MFKLLVCLFPPGEHEPHEGRDPSLGSSSPAWGPPVSGAQQVLSKLEQARSK